MAGPATAWLSTLVFEALDKVASPDARNELISAALREAGLVGMPSSAEALLAFAVGSLCDVVSERLGSQAGDALVQDLEPILQHAVAAAEPEPTAGPAVPSASPRDGTSAPDSKRTTLRMARDQLSAQLSQARPVRAGAAAGVATAGQAKRNTFPYLHAVIQQAEARQAVLIDDERAFLGGYAGVFKQRGFLVFTAPDSAAALALCQRLTPEFVLVDMGMPEFDARAFAAQVAQALGDQAPLLALLCDPEDVVALDPTVARCFAKGMTARALVEELAGVASGQ